MVCLDCGLHISSDKEQRNGVLCAIVRCERPARQAATALFPSEGERVGGIGPLDFRLR
jgi:hypothetical protein